MVVSAGM